MNNKLIAKAVKAAIENGNTDSRVFERVREIVQGSLEDWLQFFKAKKDDA